MFAHHRKRIRLLFAIADALLTALAFQLAYFARTRLTLERVFFLARHNYVLLIAFCAVVWVALGSTQRVYDYLDSAKPRRVLTNTLRQCLLGTALVILFQYLLRLDPPLSRSFLFLLFSFAFVLLAAFRWRSPRLIGAFQRGFGSPYHIVIVGAREKAASLARNLCEGSPFKIEVTDTLDEEECREELPKLLAKQIVDEVIFDVDSRKLPALEDVFLQCDEEGVRTRVAIDFFPHVNSEITLDRVGDAPLLTFSAAPLDDVRLLLKRFFDMALSAMALLALAPAFGLIALLIKATSPGPVIFRQARCGLNGRRFVMYKFRSMVADADRMKRDLEHLSEREVAFKLSRDPRVTGVGRWLRKFSIDEFPQLYNVLRGDMSIVGPRPPLPSEVERYERWQRRRLRMRPGLTCLWAVCGRDRIDFNTWMRLDISYIENWSLKLDWSIILKSIPHVLAGKGAH
ncbi:MAG: exopolysaccharide biosynthesis polyprenyl glycosylphosphotransferase [Acidobacteriaceae bacterium]|nr:exopolysaccharide biosynthesis polyprenyl glycosylphosphotransferase [Acidobacteriaceae bacterium]